MTRPPPTSPLFPSTPLSRSRRRPTVRQSAERRSAPEITRSRGLRIFCFHVEAEDPQASTARDLDRESTRLDSSHLVISYAVFCLKKKNNASVEEGRLMSCIK